jgi:hypothetical protein
MIVKQEEWNALVKAKEKLQEKHSADLENKQKEIEVLQYEIKRLHDSLKPDEIEINLFNYNVKNSSYPYNETLSWQLHSGITLSSGIRIQILKILKNISNKLQSDYDSKLEEQKEKMKEYTKENTKQRYDKFHTKLKTLPIIVSKKRIIELFEKSHLNY